MTWHKRRYNLQRVWQGVQIATIERRAFTP